MSVDFKEQSGVLYIKINGRFDFGVHNEFREATKIAGNGIAKIEVDLANTDYLDSSALGMLLLLRDKVIDRRDSVHICNAKADVRKILEIANFDKLFVLS